MKSGDKKDSLYGSGVIVTPKSINILGQEYSVGKIASCGVRCTIEVSKPMKALSIVCFALSLGFGAMFLARHSAIFGIVAGVLGLLALYLFVKSRTQVYHVCLWLSSGITEAYSTENRENALEIVDAINKVLKSNAAASHLSLRPFSPSEKSAFSDNAIPIP
ncbi:MAG: DUF6232 family protein [Ignavibacteria bacterium]|nr:DUF6232 family protein [Ignavibacteria bacterium]